MAAAVAEGEFNVIYLKSLVALSCCIQHERVFNLQPINHHLGVTGVAKTGGFRYEDGTRYIGDWNQKGQKHGMGHLLLPDGTRYGELKIVKDCVCVINLYCIADGSFQNGICSGLGIMNFPDGSK
jgi:hypothetical protein